MKTAFDLLMVIISIFVHRFSSAHHLFYYYQLMKSFLFQLLFSPLSQLDSVPDSISMLLALSVEKII